MLRTLTLLAAALAADASCLAADADCPTVTGPIEWTIPVETQEVIATKAVVIEWTKGFHDVYRMSSKAALDACSFEAAEEIAPASGEDSVTVALPPPGETHYYSCSVGGGNHCTSGMKLAITGAPPIDPVAPGSDRDQYGCCGSCGYSWCSSAANGDGACEKPFETPCAPYVTDGGCQCKETWSNANCPDEQLGCPAEACDGWAGGRWCEVDPAECPNAVLSGDIAYDTCGKAPQNGEPVTGGPDPQPQPANTVSALIKLDPDLSKFEKLLEEHDLDDKLEKEGPWTVFGPTDKAIEDINPAEALLLALDGNGIAKYHIIKGQGLAAADLTDGMVLETWQGDTLEVMLAEGEVLLVDGFDQKALVIKADQEGSNGYLHLVDTMLFWTADGDGGGSDAAFTSAPGVALSALAALVVAALY